MREILIGGKVDWENKHEEAKERWAEVIPYWNRYTLHKEGITYAMQGYHVGDGVSIRADVVLMHRKIETYVAEIKQSAEYQRKHPKDKAPKNGRKRRR